MTSEIKLNTAETDKEMKKEILKIVNSETQEVGRFKIYKQQLELTDHNVVPYSYIDIREGVNILPLVLPDFKVVCIRQYRHTIGSWEIEIPGGFIDRGETPAEAAARELSEETGYKASKLIYNGFFYPSFGSTNEKIHLFIAKVTEKSEQDLESSELINLEVLDMDSFKDKIRNNEFRHGAGIANFAAYMLKFPTS